MRNIRYAAAMALLLTATACGPLPSLNPLWDEDHAVCEPGLPGTWISEDNDEIITIMQTGPNEYRMVYVSGNDASQYEVHAVRLEGRLFLDLRSDEKLLEERLHGEAYIPLVITHFFARADLGPAGLELAVLDEDSINSELQSGEIEIPHAESTDGLLLTADTEALQDLVVRCADDPHVWGTPSIYRRCPDE